VNDFSTQIFDYPSDIGGCGITYKGRDKGRIKAKSITNQGRATEADRTANTIGSRFACYERKPARQPSNNIR